MREPSDKFVSEKLSPLERQAVAMLFAGANSLEVMRRTGMSIAQIEGARNRQFQYMSDPKSRK